MFAGVTVGGSVFVFRLCDGCGTAGADLRSGSLGLIFAHIRNAMKIKAGIPSMASNRRLLAGLVGATAGDEACIGPGEAGARVPHRSQKLSPSRRLLPHFVQFLFTMECLYS